MPPQVPAPQPAPAPVAPPVALPAEPAASQPDQVIQQLQQQVATLTDKMNEMVPFVEDASVLISAVYQNPQMKEQLKTMVQNQVNPQQPPVEPPPATPGDKTSPPAPAAPTAPAAPPVPAAPTNPIVNSVDLKMRDDIVQQVEGNLGFSNLDAEKKKAIRGGVEKRLNQWGSSVMTAPVHQLTQLLKDAYLLENVQNAKEQGKLEELVDSHANSL